jgi:hypothetical protein
MKHSKELPVKLLEYQVLDLQPEGTLVRYSKYGSCYRSIKPTILVILIACQID